MLTDSEILDGLVAKASELLEKARKAQERANGHAEDSGLPVPFPDLISAQSVAAGRLAIRPDQFANCNAPSGAARAYLEMRAQRNMGAAPLPDIIEALKQGGYAATEAGIKVALGKDKGFRRLPNGSFGLWSWYPNVKRDDDKSEENGKAEERPKPAAANTSTLEELLK